MIRYRFICLEFYILKDKLIKIYKTDILLFRLFYWSTFSNVFIYNLID